MCQHKVTKRIHEQDKTSFPTLFLEAMIMSCVIDAKEERYEMVINIPGSYLHMDMDTYGNMLLEGTTAALSMKL